MEAQSWQKQLVEDLEGVRQLAVLGIGNELYLDDGAGVVLARELSRLKLSPERLQAFEAGPVPENFTGALRKMKPSHVLMADAANLGLAPGAIRVVDPAEITGAGFSTHTLPLKILASYIERVGSRVVIIGIQPKTIFLGDGLSPEVADAVSRVKQFIAQLMATD